jgi:ubiquinone/menaquinone biosynthesis C-methylase UbiE
MDSKGKMLDTRKYEQMISDVGASDYDRAIVAEYGMKHKYFTTAVWAKKFHEPFLDYGCGTGVASIVLARMNRKVVAFDISAKMAAATKNNIPTAQVIVADALNLPFKDRSFPTICITGVLHHILDLGRAFDEICRCGQDIVCINEPTSTSPHITVKLIRGFIHILSPLLRPMYYGIIRKSSRIRYHGSIYERPLDTAEMIGLLESHDFSIIGVRYFNHVPLLHLFLPEQIRRYIFQVLIHPKKGTHVEIIAERRK